MAGPVRKSPAAVARQDAERTPAGGGEPSRQVAVAAPIPTIKKTGLIERFAEQMGGVDPAKMMATLKATAFRIPDKKQGQNWVAQEVTNEQMMALLVVANKYGLNPFIKEIYAFPDKGGIVPIIGVDGWSRMINDHAQFDGMKFEFGGEKVKLDGAKESPESCTCIIYRKDRGHPTEVTEYLDEVYQPQRGNYPGPWQTHTKRMLRHKATIQCARLAFGFTGIHDQDEAERIVGGEYEVVNAEPTKAETLTDRFSDVEPEKEQEKEDAPIDGEFIEKEKPEATTPLPAEEPKQDPPPKKPAKKKVAKKPAEGKGSDVMDTLNALMAAQNVDAINAILDAVAANESLTQAKRLIIKKAAGARIAELTET